MSTKSCARVASSGRETVTHSMMELIVTVAASLIMVLMVAGGGMAVERMTATELTDREPAPLSPLESS